MHPLNPTIFTVLLAHIIGPSWAEYLLHTFSGQVGSGNYTYYKLSKEGNVRLILETTLGDSDLYISDQTLTPDFDIYDLKSATCGEDEVYIPAQSKRPVGVGVYGHFSHEVSHYRLHVFVDDEGSKGGTHMGSFSSGSTTGQHKPSLNAPKNEEESLLWTIFVGILKIIFDILV